MAVLENYPRITPFLWFDANAEPAVDHYVAIFPNSKKLAVNYASDFGGGKERKPLTIAFELDGQPFTALNGGPVFKFTEAISFVVRCANQEEVDYYWQRLSEGGAEIQCGWLKDKFGITWQVIPARLPDLIKKPKAYMAMMTMKKIDLAVLEKAAAE